MNRWFPHLVSILILVVATRAAEGQAAFTARLSGPQEVPGVVTTAAGTACLTLTSAGVQFFVTAEGLSGPISAIHIHNAQAGVNGPVVRTLTGNLWGNTAEGLWTSADAEPLTPALIDELLKGNLYVNVHTAANPGGEIRGQIAVSGGAHFTANLEGNQENPPLTVGGTGTASLTLTEEALIYKITVSGLTGAPTAAHFHTAAIGINGPVTINILPSFSGTTATGTVVLTVAQRRDLISGNMYVNVHTAANPGGEIRGQINLGGGFAFSARLDGSQEVPANASAGTATASLTLTPSGLLVDLTATGLSGAITAAHFHNAASGVNGPVVRTLTGDFIAGTTTASALWRYDDAEPLTPALVAELLAGRLYINLHTAAFGGGEIRGQVTLDNPSASNAATFTARLTKDQEEPPTAATGHGTGTFRLTSSGLEFNVTVDGLSGPITAAHFHNAPIGVNGTVVRPITADFVGNTASGIWTPADATPLTAALITELLKGNLYVNVHTAANPGGEIRGQVLLASGADLEARLTGQQENPPLAVAGLGSGSFALTPSGLVFSVTIDGLTGAMTAAHFHNGAPGINGPVVRPITTDFVGNTARGVWKPTDASPLTAALVTELMKGNLYVNVHTGANPGGEIRGQVRLADGDSRGALLLGQAEVPPVNTVANGTASLTATDQGLVFRVSASNLSSPMTAAHFHNASSGVNGPVVRTITGDFTNLTADGVWSQLNAEPLTPTLLGALVTDNLYINIHTTTNPGGEIRGQIGGRSLAGVEDRVVGKGTFQLTNAPNPFLRGTTFTFYLPKRSEVSLKVYDLRGGEVATVLTGTREAGWQHASLDAGELATGLYFYRLRVGGASVASKMLLVR